MSSILKSSSFSQQRSSSDTSFMLIPHSEHGQHLELTFPSVLFNSLRKKVILLTSSFPLGLHPLWSLLTQVFYKSRSTLSQTYTQSPLQLKLEVMDHLCPPTPKVRLHQHLFICWYRFIMVCCYNCSQWSYVSLFPSQTGTGSENLENKINESWWEVIPDTPRRPNMSLQ